MGMATATGPAAACSDYCCCPDGLGICETITESIFGMPDPDCWYPSAALHAVQRRLATAVDAVAQRFRRSARQGWINAADGNMYRLWFFTFAEGFNHPPQGDAYLGAYTLLTPFSRRLMLITNIPFSMRNNVSGGLPTVDPEGNPDDSDAGSDDFRRCLVHAPRLAA